MTLPVFPRVLQGSLSGVAIAAVFVGAACVKRLPPAPTPARVAPAVATAAPLEAGHGRIVVDVVEGPTPVHRLRMDSEPRADEQGRTRYRFFEAPPTVLCAAAPCVADLPVGNILLGFPVIGDPGAMETELVHIAPRATAYRRSLSVYEDHRGTGNVLGIIATALGTSAGITGAVLLPVGLDKDNDSLATAGAITLGAGAAVMAIGIWAIRRDAPTFRPGSAIHFPLADPGTE